MPYAMSLIELPEIPVVSIRERRPRAELAAFLKGSFGDLFAYLGLLGESPAGPPLVIYHDFGAVQVDAEVCVPTVHQVAASGRIAGRVLAPATVARTAHVGPYEALPAAYGALAHWVEEHGMAAAGPIRERYLEGPGGTTDPAEFRTEIDLPVVLLPVLAGV